MNKSTCFTGQPIFSQLLKFVPRDSVSRIAIDTRADRYSKRFNTFEHLVTMLYAIFNNCNSLREVTTGMLASEQRLRHLGMRHYPRRSTLADANIRRSAEVFEQIYFAIFNAYKHLLSDSRSDAEESELYMIDSTTIKLFHDVLRTGGQVPSSGRCKGGIKVHTLLRSDQDVPCMIRLTPATTNDNKFLKEVRLPKGAIFLFDRGYRDFLIFNRFTEEGITWITKLYSNAAIVELATTVPPSTDKNVVYDKAVRLGRPCTKHKVNARLIRYVNEQTGEIYECLTNNLLIDATKVVELYQQRWQVEMLYKRIKQNYPLKYFLGDSENAIKIQVWCSLIADLLLKIVKNTAGSRMSFSNLASMIRLHLMTYINIFGFLKSPEKALLNQLQQSKKVSSNQLSFVT